MRAHKLIQTAGAYILCFCIVIWSVMPSLGHSPKVFEEIDDYLEMIADHGHSHGFEEDLHWAMHGHSHDVADHDHTHAFLLAEYEPGPAVAFGEKWRGLASIHGPDRQFRIDRPPRV